MENSIRINHLNPSNIEFELEIEGDMIKDDKYSVRFVIETDDVHFLIPCEVDGKNCSTVIPILESVMDQASYDYRIEVIAAGYFFEASRGVVTVINSADVNTSHPSLKMPKPRVTKVTVPSAEPGDADDSKSDSSKPVPKKPAKKPARKPAKKTIPEPDTKSVEVAEEVVHDAVDDVAHDAVDDVAHDAVDDAVAAVAAAANRSSFEAILDRSRRMSQPISEKESKVKEILDKLRKVSNPEAGELNPSDD